MGTEASISAKTMRSNVLRLAAKVGAEGKGAHIAPSLSIIEILAVLFKTVMRSCDVFVLSKGHGGLAYYSALREAGIITDAQLDSFETDGGDFPGQPTKNSQNGIIFSSGSLGMGLSYACGLALAAKRRRDGKTVYVLLGDGELNEGSNWEAIMFAKQQKLGNLVAIIDNNGMQSDGKSEEILDVDLRSAFNAFSWKTQFCDGHDIDDLTSALKPLDSDTPTAIFAKTIKGKGVSFMENNNVWHHNRLNDEQYQAAVKEGDTIGA